METLDVLIRARAEVEKGWCQDVAVDSGGNVCALGALETAVGVEKYARVYATRYDGIRGARGALTNALPADRPPSVPLFNDTPETTKADVLALFDRAINAEAVKVTADPAHTYTVA
jgi:hypothetical protein